MFRCPESFRNHYPVIVPFVPPAPEMCMNSVICAFPGDETSHSHSATDETTVDVILMRWIKSVFSKYWILVCCGAFLLVGLQNDVSMYQIGYMAIFLFLFVCYQVNA